MLIDPGFGLARFVALGALADLGATSNSDPGKINNFIIMRRIAVSNATMRKLSQRPLD